MSNDEVLQRARALLEQAAILQEELAQFYQREAEREGESGALEEVTSEHASSGTQD